MALDDWKNVYRRLLNIPSWIKSSGEISSAVFKDSKGVSVDEDGGRAIEEIIKDEERLQYCTKSNDNNHHLTTREMIAIISVSHEACDDAHTFVEPDPLTDNPYHCIIKRSSSNEMNVELTNSQAKRLARSAVFVKKYS